MRIEHLARAPAPWTAASLMCVLVAACVGEFGDAGDGGSSGGHSSASSSGTGTSSGTGHSSGGGSGSGGGTPDGGPPPVPFEPLTVPASVTKVKTMLTGFAPTQEEVSAVTANPSALSGLVTQWMQLPQYTAKMEGFFADAFQQSQAQSLDFGNQPVDELLLDWRTGFAKTVTKLIAEGRPFTETVTTTRYMMTTAMMTEYAYMDADYFTDATTSSPGQQRFRYFDNDPNWSFRLTAQSVPLADSGNPASSSYLTFTIPNLSYQYGQGQVGEEDPGGCAGIDPVIFDQSTSFALGDNLGVWLHGVMMGNNFWFGGPNGYCYGGSKFADRPSHPAFLTAADFTDWRMVTVKQATSVADMTRFFDVAGNRASTTLSLFQQRVGYFTTPAFFAQYPTNVSNQARATINQTMIVGLGQAFDGTDAITVQNAPGLDPAHAANTACFQCHWSLDPMARYFRSNYTTNYGSQLDATQTAVTGTFLFDNVVANSDTSLYYLASQIAAHPRFPLAWTLKLCAWANSGPCQANDPEVQRVANVFASSNFNWTTLVHELFTSPLVTYLTGTLSTGQTGTIVPIARRAQLCATLDSRLSLTDVCGYNFIPLQFGSGQLTNQQPSPPGCNCPSQQMTCGSACPCSGSCPDPGPIPPAAAQLSTDGYSRGIASALYINAPDPFWRSSLEQICSYVADLVVDAGTSPLYSSSNVSSAIADIAHGLMGLDSSRDAQPIAILTDHYQSVTAAGSSPSIALKSTFTAACLSPVVAAVGE